MNTNLGLCLALGVNQIFHNRYDIVSIIITNYVDDLLLVTCNDEWMDLAISGIKQWVEIGSILKSPRVLNVNGTEVEGREDVVFVQL